MRRFTLTLQDLKPAEPIVFVAEGIEIWRLKSRHSDFRCLRCPVGAGWELRIYQDADIVVDEMFPSEPPLLDRAQRLHDSMKSLGWEAV